jgi:hypothetical protein
MENLCFFFFFFFFFLVFFICCVVFFLFFFFFFFFYFFGGVGGIEGRLTMFDSLGGTLTRLIIWGHIDN